MDNYQCRGYGILALNKALENEGYAEEERAKLIRAFSAELHYFFDMKTEEEAEEQGNQIRKELLEKEY